MSDEENEDSKNGSHLAVLELLTKMVEPIKQILAKDSLESIQNQFNQSRSLPLGKIKLRVVELLQSIITLKMPSIIIAVGESKVMLQILQLIEKHPWNNMVQLKAHLIFEDVFSSELDVDQKISFLASAEVTSELVRMSQNPEIKFGSGNRIRNGFMGFVIKLANLIVKQKTISDSENSG